MKTIVRIATLAFFLGGIILSPAGAEEKTGGPRVVFKMKTFELGTLPSGGRAKFKFEFENKGDQTLVIYEVKTSCGCTQAAASPAQTAPGGKGNIEVTFDSHGFVGDIAKQVLVRSNDPAHPLEELKMKVKVLPTVEVEPKIIDYGTIHIKTGKREDLERQIVVKDVIKSGSRIRFVESDIPFLRTRIESAKNHQTRIRIWLVPTDFRGNFQGIVKIMSDSKFYPLLVMMVQGDVKD